MKTTVIVLAALATSAVAGSALAAQLGLAGSKVGAGNTAVVACDTDGFTQSYTTSRGKVTAVTVGGIADPACEGGALAVTLTNSAGTSIGRAGPQTVPTDGDALPNSMTLTLSPQPDADLVAAINVSVVGP